MENAHNINFIYCQEGNINKIASIEKNKIVTQIEKKEEKHMNQRIYAIYNLEISEGYIEKPFTLIMIDTSLNGYYKEIYPGKFQYDTLFTSLQKRETDSLNQIPLPFIEQYNIFKNYIKNDQKVFIEAIKKYFEDLNIPLFEVKKRNKKDKFSKPKIEENLKKLDIFSDIKEMRKELISITGNKEETNAKIDAFLCFYCIHFKPKSFINYVDIHNENFKEIKTHLLSYKKIFNEFNAEIMNFELMDETENCEQIQTIISNFIPNRLELFKILADERFYSKLATLSQFETQIENLREYKKIMLCERQEEDDIKKISDYFDKMMILRKKEYNYFPIKIDKNFFVDYCKMYSNKSCENIRIIKKMYDKYMEIYRKKENIGIDDYYHKTGINLISDGKLYNANLLIFLNNDPYFKEGKDISLDLI